MFTRNYLTHKILVMLLSLFYLLAMLLISPARAEISQGDFSAVDTYVEAQRDKLGIPGMAVAIVQGDQVAYLGSYGEAGEGRPVTPQTSFMIGSTSKSFTALAIMQLVEAGKVDLEAPVRTYIPWFRAADEQASAQITIQHLLTQTSGFSNPAGLTELAASDLSEQAIENSVRALADVELASAPGDVYEYSNVNFTTLGLVVQMVSGQSYESYVQEHIFGPLEMRSSFTSQDEAMQNGMSAGHITFFGLPVEKVVPYNRGNIAGGYLICSAEDLAHYLIAQLNQGRYGNSSVISPQGMEAMHAPLVNMGRPGDFYGMGWNISPINGIPAIWHDGENLNYSAALLMLPEDKLGIAVLSNANGTFVVKATSQIADGILAVLRDEQPQPYQRPSTFFIFIASTGIPALVALLWIGWTLYRFLRRQKQSLPARRNARWWSWVIGVPIFVDLNLLFATLVFIPGQWGMPFSVMAKGYPDCFLLLAGSALLVVVWSVLRTVLSLRGSHVEDRDPGQGTD